MYPPVSRAITLSLCTLLLTNLIACGGGGGGGSSPDTKKPAPTAQLAVTNDAITSISGRSGVSNISLISNDTLNNAAVTLDDITLTVQSADSPLSLGENATLTVAPMTAAGNYALTYQACLVADSSICAEGSVSVEVVAAALLANTDTVTDINGGMVNTNLFDVLANDTIDGITIPANEVTVSVSAVTANTAITMAEHMVILTADTPVGDYALTYQVCEKLNPTNCATADVNLTVNKGQFLRGNVSGIKYLTDSGSGYTDANGGFVYQSGDSISFYIGATQLGQTVNSKASLSPLDLAPGSYIPETKAQTSSYLSTYQTNDSAPTMRQLGNILTLLVSSDSDKDFTNGIQINEDLHALWNDKHFNLNQNIAEFSNNAMFKRAMYEAFNGNLMVNARRVDHLQAMDLFAKYNSVSPQVFITSKTQRDVDNNGSIDQEEQSIVDHRGILERYLSDNDVDGVADYNSDAEFDDYGNLLSSKNYTNGLLTRNLVAIYDIHGEQIQQTIDSNGDGRSNKIFNYVVDSYGNTIESTIDNEGDGKADTASYFQYNVQNQIIKTSNDNENNGSIDNHTFYDYEGTQEVKRSYDNDADDIIDSVTYFRYNSAGFLTLTENDFNNDGKINQKSETVYNENNELTLFRQDDDNNGTWDYIRTVSYNAAGLVIENITDNNGDGIFNNMTRYSYDQQNQLLTYKFFSNGNTDTPRTASNYQYDEAGNQVSFTRENNGVINSINFYTFDDQGNRLSQSIDNGGDGTIDSKILYSYDEFGNLSKQENDNNADDKIDSVTYKEYSRISFLGWSLID